MGCGAGRPEFESQQSIELYLLHSVQPGSAAEPASYTKRPGRGVEMGHEVV
jgi:hypothetical protein